MRLKYILYCRRSQDREDQQVLSIESQKRELLKYAKKHDLEVVDVICEDMSAYHRGRPKFNKMMTDIETGKANAILTWHLTRLARNAADGGLLTSYMDEKLILNLRTVEQVYLNTGNDKFMMQIHFAMAKKSSDDTSAFVKNNLKTKLANGEYPGVVPYGYLNVGPNGVISGRRFDREKQEILENLGRPLGRVELDPIEGPLIRKLLELALTGVYDLPMLQEESYKLGIKGKNSGKKLAKETVKGILTNIFYTGKFNYSGELHNGSHEPLMTVLEYEKLQLILNRSSRPKRYKHEYTYRDRVECPECGGSMSGDFQKGIHYYRCTSAKGKNSTCGYKKHIRQAVLDDWMAEELAKLRIPDSVVKWGLRLLKKNYLEENKFLTGKRTLLQKNINNERRKIERLTSKWLSESNQNGVLISDEDYIENKKVIMLNIEKFEEQLHDNSGNENNWLTQCEEFFKKLRNIDRSFNKSDVIGKHIILNQIDAKFIRKDGKLAVRLGEPFNCFLNHQEADNFVRTAEKPSMTSKEECLTVDQAKWLPGLDSNQ